MPTDDWPFLYLREPTIPGLSLRGMAIVAALSAAILLTFAPVRRVRPDGRMFFLGAGFMLLETKGVVHMALLFGATWLVNSIVFFAILTMILLANLYVSVVRPVRLAPYYVMLLTALAINAAVPMDVFLGLPDPAKVVASCALVYLPVFFAGVIFATAFRSSTRPDVNFGSNIGGIILGGLSEYLSLIVGFNHLLWIAVAYYLLSWLLGARRRRARLRGMPWLRRSIRGTSTPPPPEPSRRSSARGSSPTVASVRTRRSAAPTSRSTSGARRSTPRWWSCADTLELIDRAGVVAEATFPYLPGLLSFREAPPVIEAFGRLSTRPDILLCDGQGIAHPRRLGLASHLGLWLGIPTIGCAKSRLFGSFAEPGQSRGDWSPLKDGDETIGAVLRTRDRVSPLFVSPGHLCDLEGAIAAVLDAARRYRLPATTRLAHDFVNEMRRRGGT